MNSTSRSPAFSGNRVIDLLPSPQRLRLMPVFKPVSLKRKEVLYQTNERVEYCYFPSSGIVSLLSTTEGKTVEIAMVGSEGLIGASALLKTDITPHDSITQTDTEALKIDAAVLKAEFEQDGALRAVLLRYVYALLCQISQTSVCHHFHTVEQRLARRLLMSRDSLDSNTFSVTQEFLAYLLGVPRTNVTMTAGDLQRAGLIEYKRGTVTIINEKDLEKAACDCYKILRNATGELFK